MAAKRDRMPTAGQTSHHATKIVIAAVLILAAIVLTVIAVAWASRTSAQRGAIAALEELGVSAIQRTGLADCLPSFVFDKRPHHAIEDVTGPAYYRNVIEVWFNRFDDQQLVESIPFLLELPQLKRVGFYSSPNEATVARMREVLPGATFVDRQGRPLPD
jgi:hypothetical protein